MFKINDVEVRGLGLAIIEARKLRGSSRKESDSRYLPTNENINNSIDVLVEGECAIGLNDIKLMQSLIKSNNLEFLKQITVSMDITAPMYFIQEFNFSDININRKSLTKEFTLDDFSHEHLSEHSLYYLKQTIETINFYRKDYLHPEVDANPSNKNDYWWQIAQLLPASYNQTVLLNTDYYTLRCLYSAYCKDELNEWSNFCKELLELPFAKQLIIAN